MSNFTTEQIAECIIIKCDSFRIGPPRFEVHQYWDIEVQDNNGNIYRILNYELGSDASDNEIKDAIRTILRETEKIADPRTEIESTTSSKEDILNQNVG